jgi:hypothetical protein
MKNLLFVLLIVSTVCRSQTSQDHVDANDDVLNRSDYTLPLVYPNSNVTIITWKTPSGMDKTILLEAETPKCEFTKGISMTFSDKEVMKFENNKLKCTPLDDGSYVLSGEIFVTEEMYAKLSAVDMTEFRLGSLVVPVVYKDPGTVRNVLEFIKSRE